MTVIEGFLSTLLPGQSDWREMKAGNSFEIEANCSFQIRAEAPVSYLCKYKRL